jgi:exopolyphosphatase / guanosine-5'-triphosphate,3'-diphosphate pyrophosphatase
METALVPGVGVREGILYDLAAEHFRSPGADKHRAEALIEQARGFASRMHCDQKHSEHVRMLAASMFDQLADVHTMPHEDRLPLEMAALLHHTGMNVNVRGHHKHGEYIVQHAEMGGISEGLQSIVACLVRYHGKSEPEAHHKLYASLTARQRRRVRELSSILRIANGLDDAGIQSVQNVRVKVRRKSVRFQIHALSGAVLDLAALTRKARPFAQEFGVRVTFKRGRVAVPQSRSAASHAATITSWKPPLTGNVWTLSA